MQCQEVTVYMSTLQRRGHLTVIICNYIMNIVMHIMNTINAVHYYYAADCIVLGLGLQFYILTSASVNFRYSTLEFYGRTMQRVHNSEVSVRRETGSNFTQWLDCSTVSQTLRDESCYI